MKIFLIRHGQTPWTTKKRYQGTTDIPLNQTGTRQGRAIAQALRRESLSRLYTSTLSRAWKTADLIGQTLGLKSVADPRLNEIDFGKWEGVSYVSLARSTRQQFQRWREGSMRRPPGGESIASLQRRVGQFLGELLVREKGKTVAIVAHGGPIKMFLFRAMHIEKCRSIPLPSIWSLRIDPASISCLEGDSNLLQIIYTNNTSHLSK